MKTIIYPVLAYHLPQDKGLTYQQIATCVGISRQAVHQHVHKVSLGIRVTGMLLKAGKRKVVLKRIGEDTPYLSPDRYMEILKSHLLPLYSTEMTPKACREVFGTDKKTARRWLKPCNAFDELRDISYVLDSPFMIAKTLGFTYRIV